MVIFDILYYFLFFKTVNVFSFEKCLIPDINDNKVTVK